MGQLLSEEDRVTKCADGLGGSAVLEAPSDSSVCVLSRCRCRRLEASCTGRCQEPSSSMPADKFSKKVVSAALAARPPRYLTLGGKSFLFMLALWLPRTLLLTYIWKRFLKRN